MWVAWAAVGSCLIVLGAVAFARPSLRRSTASAKGTKPAVPRTARWLALVSVLLGVVLVVVGFSVRDASEAGTSAGGPPQRVGAPDASTSLPPATGSEDARSPAQTPATGQLSETNSYRVTVVGVNSQIAQQLEELTGFLVNARYGDASWVAEMQSTLKAMETTAEEARAITPTPEYRAAHAAWIEGIDSYDWAAENLAVAIEGPDQQLIDQSMDRLESASASFKRAMTLIQEVDAE